MGTRRLAAVLLLAVVLSAGWLRMRRRPPEPVEVALRLVVDPEVRVLPRIAAQADVRVWNRSAKTITIGDPQLTFWVSKSSGEAWQDSIPPWLGSRHATFGLVLPPGAVAVVRAPLQYGEGCMGGVVGENGRWPAGKWLVRLAYEPGQDAMFSVEGADLSAQRLATVYSAPFVIDATVPDDTVEAAAFRCLTGAGSLDTIERRDMADRWAFAAALGRQRRGIDRLLFSSLCSQLRHAAIYAAGLQVGGDAGHTARGEWYALPDSDGTYAWINSPRAMVEGPLLEQRMPLDEMGLDEEAEALLRRMAGQSVARRNRLLLGLAYAPAVRPSPDEVWLRYPGTVYARSVRVRLLADALAARPRPEQTRAALDELAALRLQAGPRSRWRIDELLHKYGHVPRAPEPPRLMLPVIEHRLPVIER